MKLLVAIVVALAFALPAAAAQAPTLQATPQTVGMLGQVSLSGNAGSARAGQSVYVEAKECTASFYRVVAAATSAAGGGWATTAPAQMTTTYRARVNRAYSRAVTVHKRAVLAIQQLPGRVFMIRAFGGRPLIGRKVRVERLTASGWVSMQQVRLRQSEVFGAVEASVRIKQKGMRIRAFLPLAAARPCYVAGASTIVTT